MKDRIETVEPEFDLFQVRGRRGGTAATQAGCCATAILQSEQQTRLLERQALM